jgi:uncharacterized OsmC-like protein
MHRYLVLSSKLSKINQKCLKLLFECKHNGRAVTDLKLHRLVRIFRYEVRRSRDVKAYSLASDYPDEMGDMSKGPTVCEMCMASIGSCISQTIVAYATMIGVQLDSIRIQTEGDVDIRGFTGVSEDVRLGAEEFRMDIHLESKTASKEQLERL